MKTVVARLKAAHLQSLHLGTTATERNRTQSQEQGSYCARFWNERGTDLEIRELNFDGRPIAGAPAVPVKSDSRDVGKRAVRHVSTTKGCEPRCVVAVSRERAICEIAAYQYPIQRGYVGRAGCRIGGVARQIRGGRAIGPAVRFAVALSYRMVWFEET